MKRLLPPIPNRHKSPVYSYDGEIAAADGKIKVTAYANALAHIKSKDIKPILVQFNPGAFATRATTEPLVEDLIRIATEKNQAMKVVVHRAPFERDAYLQEKRIRRLGRVVTATAQAEWFKDDPQHMLGHSWVWGDTVRTVNDLKNEDGIKFGSIVGLTPNGHPPAPKRWGWLNFPLALAQEVRRLPQAFPVRRLGSLAVGAALTGSILARFARAPITTCREIAKSRKEDVTGLVGNIGRSIGVAALLAEHDQVADPGPTTSRLNEVGVASENIITIPDSSHLSLVTDHRRTAEYLYPILEAQHNALLAARAVPVEGF